MYFIVFQTKFLCILSYYYIIFCIFDYRRRYYRSRIKTKNCLLFCILLTYSYLCINVTGTVPDTKLNQRDDTEKSKDDI